jgi:hypothetical protein
MIFDWFKIFNLTEFTALELVSKDYTLELEGIGEKTISVFKGVDWSIQYEGVFLTIQLTGANPFIFDGYAVYQDPETQDIYLGIEVEA